MTRFKRILRGTLITLLVLSTPLYWIGSEAYYAHSIQPLGVVTVADFYHRFGSPSRICKVESEGIAYFQLRGTGPGRFVLAVPSGYPEYIFDQSGQLIDWNEDPGDTSYASKRNYTKVEDIDPISFEKQFGINR